MRTLYALLGLVLGMIVNNALHRHVSTQRNPTEPMNALQSTAKQDFQQFEFVAASNRSCAFAAQDYYDR